MIRTAVKSVVAGTLYYSGLVSALERSRDHSTPAGSCIILMYHRVLPFDRDIAGRPDWERYQSLPGIVVSPEMFDAQLHFLATNYKVISLADMLGCFDSQSRLPHRAVVITFDDGWRDNYVHAFPTLKKYNLTATIFLSTGFIGGNAVFWPERVIRYFMDGRESTHTFLDNSRVPVSSAIEGLIRTIGTTSAANRLPMLDRLIGEMKQLAPEERETLIKALFSRAPDNSVPSPEVRVMLDWNEIAQMQAAGISFGSHGISHELLTLVTPAQQERELRDSRGAIEGKLGTRIDSLAYPNGNYDDHINQLARQSGYRCALAVTSAHVSLQSDRYALGRINVHQGNSRGIFGGFSRAIFACHIQRVIG